MIPQKMGNVLECSQEGKGMGSGNRKCISKYDKPIKINAPPMAVVKSLFHGKPKPRSQWRYLKTSKDRPN